MIVFLRNKKRYISPQLMKQHCNRRQYTVKQMREAWQKDIKEAGRLNLKANVES